MSEGLTKSFFVKQKINLLLIVLNFYNPIYRMEIRKLFKGVKIKLLMEGKKETGKHNVHHEHSQEHTASENTTHEHHEMKIDNNPDAVDISRVKKNPWMIVSVILAVVVIVLLVMMYTSSSVSGKTVTGKVAADNVVKFAQGQGLAATYTDVNDLGAFYEVNLSMNGQEFPVYVTKDGEKMATGLIPLTGSATTNPTTPTTPKEVTKSDKPKVELFIMTHCPYGTQAEKGIIPAYKALGAKADTKIRFVHYFMHGEKEETETYNQVCIREEQSAKFLPYLECFLEDSDSARCLTKAAIDKTKLNACLANDKKKAKEYYEVDKKLSNEYGVQGSPTLIINGGEASGGRDSASYLSSICSAFNTAPTAECSKQLSSASPSPGFGTSTAAAGSASAAQCG